MLGISINVKPSLVKTIRSPKEPTCVCLFSSKASSPSRLVRSSNGSLAVACSCCGCGYSQLNREWIFFVLASSHLAVDLTLDVPLDSFLFILTLPRILAHRFSELVHNHRFCPDLMLVRVYRSPQQRLAHVHRVAVAVELC